MKKAALVIMAAGMGSRYGGNKQVDGVGPGGEILMEYSVFDAVRAGFTKVVFIIKPEMEALMHRLCGDRAAQMKTADGTPVEVCYAFQDFSSVPSFYPVPPARVKPFGTAHALLCARDHVSEPFAVINADDYYGRDAFDVMCRALASLPAEGEAAMVGYLLGKTVSEHGSVTRGVCHVENGVLERIVETYKLTVFPDGSIRDVADDPAGVPYAAETVVSMGFWGFMPSVFSELDRYFRTFLKTLSPDEQKAECLLPGLVGELVEQGKLRVHVLHSSDRWIGMTNHEDRDTVARGLRALHDSGIYPPTLR